MSSVSSEENPYRLPRAVLPSHYDLCLVPDLEAAVFEGDVTITCVLSEEVDEIVLNAADLDVSEAIFQHNAQMTVCEILVDEEQERISLRTGAPFPVGECKLVFHFAGILNDKLRGFYRSTFTDAVGKEQVIATSQMESTDARRAFPCFDEPDFKAVFGVTLIVDEGFLALSNGREISGEPLCDADGRKTNKVIHRFADTMKMSTYLVAFVVGPLQACDPVDVDGVPIRVVHQPGKEHLTEYALEVAAFSLRWFVDYYGIPYPGDKLDLVALPDFAFGAMENLGCVTFREVALLIDPEVSSSAELKRVAHVVAHEIAHMWFGDLVTMKWWNGIWLNEAFATFMEVAAADAFRPEWKCWEHFSLDRSAAFGIDALLSTRPVEFEVTSPAEAEGMFDLLTYEKGGSVLRQLEQYLGANIFQEGVRAYLHAYSYGNTDTGDLWSSIESVAHLPVGQIMESWIFQKGFPLLTVSREDNLLRCRQERFSYLEAEQSLWSVPVIVRTGEGTGDENAPVPVERESLRSGREDRFLLDKAEESFDVGSFDWAVVNAGAHGFYRVRYDAELALPLAAHAQDLMTPAERHGFVDDAWAAVLAGAMPASDFLELAQSFATENSLSVWRAISDALWTMRRLVKGPGEDALAGLVVDLVSPELERLGWVARAGDDPLTKERRGVLLRLLGALGKKDNTVLQAREAHDCYLADPRTVDADVAAACAMILAERGDVKDYEVFVDRFREAITPQEETRYLRLLPVFRDSALLDRSLAMTLEGVRSQDVPFVLAVALTHREYGVRAWSFVQEHWTELNERLASNTVIRMLGGLPALGFSSLSIEETQRFFVDHPLPQGARTLEQYFEKMRVNRALQAREEKRLAEFLC